MDQHSTLHASTETLAGSIANIRSSPANLGTLELIVARPSVDQRSVLDGGELHPDRGLVGDSWTDRPSSRNEEGEYRYDTQLTLMNTRAAAAVATHADRWALAGDQLYVDLDLSETNLPVGTRVQVGEQAVIEVSAKPHTGCAKFAARFGRPALKWVNSTEGMALKLRGINARVVTAGAIRTGDRLTKLPPGA